MPDFVGNIQVPEVSASGTFPIVSDWPHEISVEPEVVVHQFGSANIKIEQRFYRGPGAKKYTVIREGLNAADWAALRAFWEARQGPYQPFTYNAPNEDGSGTTPVLVRFEAEPLTADRLGAAICSVGVTLIGEPAAAPSYSVSSTATRFPGGGLQAALLSQVQELIPLVKIQPKQAGYPAIYLSDRRVTVGGQLYLPRLIDFDGISQSIGNESDDANFTFGNADRVMRDLANDVDLWRASVEFSLFHVGSTTKLDLWKGEITHWDLNAGPEFKVRASDGIYELNLPYPTRRISRTCWKQFNDGAACPYSTSGALDLVIFPSASADSCDKGYGTPNGCRAHGMNRYFGGIVAEPQGVRIKDYANRKIQITATSQIADSVYDQVVPEVYTDSRIPVKAKVVGGRDESDFYTALGIVSEGPIGAYFPTQMVSNPDGSQRLVGHMVDGQPHHGFGTAQPGFGLREGLGSDPAGATDYFAIDQSSGWPPADVPFAAGTAFVMLRRNDVKGIQVRRVTETAMEAVVAQGMSGYVWTAPGSRTLQAGLTNPVWVAINMFLRARGLWRAAAAAQEEYFDVAATIAAANICASLADKVIGDGQETQFRFRGVLDEEKPLRDWIQEILMNCLGYYTFSFGRLKPGVRINSSVAEAFTAGNILHDSVAVSPARPKFNHLTANFADEEFEYVANSVTLYDADHASLIGGATSPLFLKSTMNLSGTSSKSQAARILTVRLREELGGSTLSEMRKAREIAFKTTVLALNVEPGMVCSLTHGDMPDGAGEFRVTGWRLNKDFSIDIVGRTTTDSMYDLTTGPKPADVAAIAPPGETYIDLVPRDVQPIPVDGGDPVPFKVSVSTDGIRLLGFLRYDPPSPVGTFDGVSVYFRAPKTTGDLIFAGNHDYNGTIDATGDDRHGTVAIVAPLPGEAAEWDILLAPRSRTYSAPVSAETPFVTINVPAAAIDGATIGDVATPSATHEIQDGRVRIRVTGTAPIDDLFAGNEVFLEIPQEGDITPENPTLPGQLYPQGWHFGEPSTSETSKTWEANLDLPVPPEQYLQGLVEPIVKWVIYLLPRSWGHSNRLRRLTALGPAAPEDHTPFVAVTIDFTNYLAGLDGDALGSVTLVGDPVVSNVGGELQVAQDYIPPYFGIEGAFTIGSFEGVAAVLEMADGTVYDRGVHPYTANPDAPGENVDVVRISMPKPATYPVTAYLHMMSYSPTERQKFKKVVNGGVPTVHAQYAIRQFAITEEGARPAVPDDFAIVFDGYHADATGVKKGRVDASWTGLVGQYIYGLWVFEGNQPPVHPSQWRPTGINTFEEQVTFWVDVPTTATRLYFALVWQTPERALTPTDYGSALPVAFVDLPSPHVAVTLIAPARTWLESGDLRLRALRSATSGYLPPTTGNTTPPTLDPMFAGVQVFWERPGEPGRPYRAGSTRYDGDVAGILPATLGEVDVTIPRGEIPAAGLYALHLVPYGPAGESPYIPRSQAPDGQYWLIEITPGELTGTPSVGVPPTAPSNVRQRVQLLGPTTYRLTVIWDPPVPVGSNVGYDYEMVFGDAVTPPGPSASWEPIGSIYGGQVSEAGSPVLPRQSVDKHIWTRAASYNDRGERSAWVYGAAPTALARVAPPTPTEVLSAALVVSSPPGHAEAYTLVVTPTMPVPATGAIAWQIRRGAFANNNATGQIGDWIHVADQIPVSQNDWTFGAWERPAPGAEFYAGIEIRLIHADGSATAWVPCATPLPPVNAAPAPLSNFSNLSTIHHGVVDGVPSYWFTKRASFPAQTDWATIYWLKVEARAFLDAGMTDPDSEWIDLGGLDPRGSLSGAAYVTQQETSAQKMEDYATWWKVRITPLNVDNAPGTPVEVVGLELPASAGIDASSLDLGTLDKSLGVIDGQLAGLRRGLVINGDFSAGARGWNFNGDGSSIISGADAYSGNSLQMTGGAGDRFVSQMISGFSPGQVVRMEVYAWSNLTGGTANAIIQFLDSEFGFLHNEDTLIAGGAAWTLYRAVKAAPANTAYVQIVFAVPPGSSGNLRIDNVTLTTEEPTSGALTRTADGVAVNVAGAIAIVDGNITVNLGDGMTITAGKLTPLLGDRLVIVDELGQRKLTAAALTNLEAWGLHSSYFKADGGFLILEAAALNFLMARDINLTGEMRINNSATDAYIALNANGAAFVKGNNSVNISAGGIVITNGTAVLSLLSNYVIAEALQVKQGTTVCFTATSTLLQIQGELKFAANGGIDFTYSGAVTGFTMAKVTGLNDALAAKAPLIYSGDQTVNEKLAELESRVSALEP